MAKKIVIPDKPNINASVTKDLIGQSIRYVRTSSELTIEDAAALVGVSKQSFSDAEHGKSGCRMGTILKITNGLGIKIYIEHPLFLDDAEDDDWR